jgi:hypothetical protein
MIIFTNKIVKCRQSNRNVNLKVKGIIMRREIENLESILENPENTLDNIVCLSMTKVE